MTALRPVEDRRLLGIALLLGALLGFTGIDTCAKWLALSGVPTAEVVFLRYAGHLVLVIALASAAGDPVWRSAHPGTEALRGLVLLAATALNFVALNHLPLSTTGAVFFTAPLWICVLSVALLGERMGPRRWAAVLAGFAGALVVTRPWSDALHWAVLLSIASAFGAALYMILTRRLAGRDSPATQQFFTAAIATLGIAPLALPGWVWPDSATGWGVFGLIGLIGWGAHQLAILAHRYAAASTLAPFYYVQILAMVASGWVVFGDLPDLWVVSGAAIIVAAGLYIWSRERALARSIAARR